MFQQDHILRQVQQFAQVLAHALFHKRAGRTDEAQEAIADGLADALGVGLDALCRLPRAEVLALCASDEDVQGGLAVAVADVLREADPAAARERALWLYEATLASGGAVPFDVHERIGALRASLS